MRTTLELDDAIHELARRRAFEARRSIGDIISEWAAKGLAAEQQALAPRPLGRFQGQITVADDFDATPHEVIEALDRPVA